MKTSLLSIFFFLLFAESKSQTVASNCNAPDNVIKKYKKSADKLAVRRVEYIGDTYKDSITINKQISKQYLKALLAVYNATALAGRDTVVAIPIVLDYKIPYDLNSIFFTADSSQTWMKNLRNNNLPCGNASIDFLIGKYYLNRVSYSNFSYAYSYHGVSFRTDSNCHIFRLCDKFNALYQLGFGFNTAYPDNEGKSPNFDIIDSVNANFIELKYMLAWGDCMAGCIYKRYWTFRVYNDCSVEYKGSYGNPLNFDVFTGMNRSEHGVNWIKYYPNPAYDKLNIEFESPYKLPRLLEIINSFGATVDTISNLKQINEINISFLPSGIYFINIVIGETRNLKFKFLVSR